MSFFNLVLDTTGPSNPTIIIDGNAQWATSDLVNAAISTSDGVTTGYQMKIWGDLDLAWCKTNGIVGAGATKVEENDALWIAYAISKQLKLSNGDGNKIVYLKLRDDVYNVSAQASDSIILDTTRPIVTITGPDVSKISTVSGKNVSSFSFTVDSIFVEYKVKVVNSTGASHDTGTQIPITAGSTKMSDTGNFNANTAINCTINGSDLKTASAIDGTKIIKVFVKDEAGNWSA